MFLSLVTANSLTSNRTNRPMEEWRFYVGREILPDNILYPVLMARDRLRLDATEPADQPALKLSYAEKRYQTAVQLLEQDQGLLAVSTLTKSQKYLLSAGYQAVNMNSDDEELGMIRKALDSSLYRLDTITQQYPQYDFSILIQLKEDTRALIKQIDEKTAADTGM